MSDRPTPERLAEIRRSHDSPHAVTHRCSGCDLLAEVDALVRALQHVSMHGLTIGDETGIFLRLLAREALGTASPEGIEAIPCHRVEAERDRLAAQLAKDAPLAAAARAYIDARRRSFDYSAECEREASARLVSLVGATPEECPGACSECGHKCERAEMNRLAAALEASEAVRQRLIVRLYDAERERDAAIARAEKAEAALEKEKEHQAWLRDRGER